MKPLKLEELSLDQKLGMVLCARGLNEPENFEYTLELVKNRAIGSIQVPADKNAPEAIRKIRAVADYPVIIINDMERGYPASDIPKVPSMTLAACNRDDYYRNFARCTVAEAREAGFSGAWGPVVDILHCDGPFRVSRMFGDTGEKVAHATAEIAKVFVENGFIATAKHYPGGDDDTLDTHMSEGKSNFTKEQLLNDSLVPYFELMKQGLMPAVMSGHRVFNDVDPDHPASLSKPVIDLIRDRGYDGVIFTDSFAMSGILQKYGEENIIGMAIAAGNDIVLPNYRTTVKKCFEMLKKNYLDGAFDDARLDEAVRRVLALQEFSDPDKYTPIILNEEEKNTTKNAARDCITAVTDDGVCPALSDPNRRRLFIIMTEMGFDESLISEEANTDTWYFPRAIEKYVNECFPGAEVAFIPEYATAVENDRLLTKATRHDEIVFVTFCTTTSYLGTDCMTRRAESLINSLIVSGKVSAIVHFGNPHAVQPLYHVPRVIFGYSATPSQEYANKTLAGKHTPTGKLPFDIKLK